MVSRPWNDSELEYLKDTYPRMRNEKQKEVLAEKLYRSIEEMEAQAAALQLGAKEVQPAVQQSAKLPATIKKEQAIVPRRSMSEHMSQTAAAPKKQYAAEKYDKVRKGWRSVGGKRCYFRSLWEYNIACYLEMRKRTGQIQSWEYEPDTFWFHQIKRGVRSYTPDFKVVDAEGKMYYIEVKGHMDSRSRTKLKRMQKYYPAVQVEVYNKKRYLEIKKNAQFIEGWTQRI